MELWKAVLSVTPSHLGRYRYLTPRDRFLRSARLLSERCLPLLLSVGLDDLGLPLNHDVALLSKFECVDEVEFMEC